MTTDSISSESETIKPATWKSIIAPYEKPSPGRAIGQIANTFLPYALTWYLIYLSLPVSLWLVLPLVILAGGLLVRIFIIFHDCTHGSFFASRTANNITGFMAGLFTFTPYFHWRWEHNIHHATAGDLDRRSVGDIWTMTVKEYQQASPWQRFIYRIARNPIVLFAIAPLGLFMIAHRFASPKANRRERLSVYMMNLAILVMATLMSLAFGFKTYAILQLLMMMIAGGAGIWMFYVQHQFEDVYWERGDKWDYTLAALKGSSYYKLPKVLQWFTGNIGFHHVHHLSPRIPNYYLERCHRSNPLFQNVKPVTLLSSLKCLSFRLWDEEKKKLVGFPQN
jgi:omega-6 fatty acid desaturase (delta-12 desaturase)